LCVWNLPEGMKSCQDANDDGMNMDFFHLKINIQNIYNSIIEFISLNTFISVLNTNTRTWKRPQRYTINHWIRDLM
jgi:hypothetical protein